MKKTLLLSVAASAMIMAGGDIAPVEPAVAAPAVSGWDFSGNMVVYYQTSDTAALAGQLATTPISDSLFAQDTSWADAGVQLRATNNDVFAGIGMGVELNGLATLGLEEDLVSGVMQFPGNTIDPDGLTGGWISQAYLTYGFGNTSIKVGRQTLPKALSPLAYSENWNVFANTFDAALIVNSDLPDTTAVLAYVNRANYNTMGGTMGEFSSLGTNGAFMLTLQNKSIENVTLTGSYYDITDAAKALWADVQIAAGDFTIGLQGGQIDPDATGVATMDSYGVKVATVFNGINVAAAYSSTEDGMMHQVGGETSALYTDTVINQVDTAVYTALAVVPNAEDKFTISASGEAFGGTLTGVYANISTDYNASTLSSDANEFDLVYSTNLTDNLNLTAAYVYYDNDALADTVQVIRVVGTYSF